jgi:hypothetical protein
MINHQNDARYQVLTIDGVKPTVDLFCHGVSCAASWALKENGETGGRARLGDSLFDGFNPLDQIRQTALLSALVLSRHRMCRASEHSAMAFENGGVITRRLIPCARCSICASRDSFHQRLLIACSSCPR